MKFKITSKGIRAISEDVIDNGQRDKVDSITSKVNILATSSVPANTRKRRAEMSPNSHKAKKQKMERNVKRRCAGLLKELMTHSYAWMFNEPVDPVKLNIPDYFSVISNPMDLGTIRNKLERDVYSDAEEFASDVRLTFDNAILYNPPELEVHICAKKLNRYFNQRWKFFDGNMKCKNDINHQANVADCKKTNSQDKKQQQHMEKNGQAINKDVRCIASLSAVRTTCKPMSLEERRNLRLEILKLSSRKMMGNLPSVLKNFGLTSFDKEQIGCYLDSVGDEELWKLRSEIKGCFGETIGKMVPKKCSISKRTVQKGHCDRSDFTTSNHNQSIKCSICDSQSCSCMPKSGSADVTSSDTSERSTEHNHSGDCKVKYTLAVDAYGIGSDSDGPGVVVNEENNHNISIPATTSSSGEGWTTFNVQISPHKALRAAMLKSRFADTIYKAICQRDLNNSEKLDPAKIQKEKERLVREHQEEKARIEAEIKAAQEASRNKARNDLMLQRERERSAARIALQMLEKTVEIYENTTIFKELETLCYGSSLEGYGDIHHGNPLERIGLCRKEDDMEYDEDVDAVLNTEEGEILL